MPQPAYVITLVHGTFAADAPWIKENSVLRETLDRELGGCVHFIEGGWTGQNSHRARLQAGQTIAAMLETALTSFPESKHVVIAHSHGGNVVLYALSHRTIAANLHAVVTMGTPFISCEPRNIDKTFDTFRYMVPALAFIPFFVIPYLAMDTFSSKVLHSDLGEHNLLFDGTIISMMISATYGTRGLHRLFDGWLRNWALQAQQQRMQDLEVSVPNDLKLLCGTIKRDEAGLVLSGMHTVSHIPFVAFNLSLLIARWVFGLLAFAVLIATFTRSDRSDSFILYGMYIGAALLLFQIPLAIVPRMIRATKVGFGGETMTDNWFCNIYNSQTPPRIECALTEVAAAIDTPSWRHSCFYENTQFLTEVAQWIQSLPDRRPRLFRPGALFD